MKHVAAAILVVVALVAVFLPGTGETPTPAPTPEPIQQLSDASAIFREVAKQDRDAEFLLLMVKQLVEDGALTDGDYERFDKAITSITGGRGLHVKLTEEDRKVLSSL
jgi:hypothetical protein